LADALHAVSTARQRDRRKRETKDVLPFNPLLGLNTLRFGLALWRSGGRRQFVPLAA
jgi:hypothetical protein